MSDHVPEPHERRFHVYFDGGTERVTIHAESKREARMWAECEHPGRPIFQIHEA